LNLNRIMPAEEVAMGHVRLPRLFAYPQGRSEMDEIGQYLARMRATPPLVQNITNYVAMNVMANVLLACGASPAMVHAREETAEFTGFTQALTINIGTLSASWAESMLLSASVATTKGTPWVLDPVAAGATTFRRETAARLVALQPTVVRGNASEILAVAGEAGRGKGVDSADGVEAAEDAARRLAALTGGVVAVTGPVDYVTDGRRGWRIANGDEMMPRVTALGCSLTGVVGAFIAGQPAAEATVAALAFFGLAGEIAASTATGPGSFQVAFLDALWQLTPETLTARARVTPA
jgi:hydroxyethylthiazole kinase